VNILRGSLRGERSEVRCETALFTVPVEARAAASSGKVFVGIRPEHIRFAHRPETQEIITHPLQFDATVALREDLGGEDIVYLTAQGVALTMVDRDHDRRADIDQRVTISIAPRRLLLFDAATGAYLGHGAAHAGESVAAAGVRHG
jgi:ABC-type sugar transport system ATPase subunit